MKYRHLQLPAGLAPVCTEAPKCDQVLLSCILAPLQSTKEVGLWREGGVVAQLGLLELLHDWVALRFSKSAAEGAPCC